MSKTVKTTIYAPETTETTVTQTLTEGTEIGSVNGTKLYAPEGTSVTVESEISNNGVLIAKVNGNNIYTKIPSIYLSEVLDSSADFPDISGHDIEVNSLPTCDMTIQAKNGFEYTYGNVSITLHQNGTDGSTHTVSFSGLGSISRSSGNNGSITVYIPMALLNESTYNTTEGYIANTSIVKYVTANRHSSYDSSTNTVTYTDVMSVTWESVDSGTTVEETTVTPTLTSGTEIATVTKGSNTETLYAPKTTVTPYSDIFYYNAAKGNVISRVNGTEIWNNNRTLFYTFGTDGDTNKATRKTQLETLWNSTIHTSLDTNIVTISSDTFTSASDLYKSSDVYSLLPNPPYRGESWTPSPNSINESVDRYLPIYLPGYYNGGTDVARFCIILYKQNVTRTTASGDITINSNESKLFALNVGGSISVRSITYTAPINATVYQLGNTGQSYVEATVISEKTY